MKRKHAVYNTIGASLLLTAVIAGVSGIDLVGLAQEQANLAADRIGAAARFPVMLPVWAVAVLCLPTIWFFAAIARAITNAFRGIAEWRTQQQLRPRRGRGRKRVAAVEASGPAATGEATEASESEEAFAAPAAREGYFEDALFGVVWRWPAEPDGGELAAHCAACDTTLEPRAKGGSLSRGLHCAECHKLRAAGEHPDEIFEKVATTLSDRKRSGEWRSAPRRVNAAQSAATRSLEHMPAA